MSSDKKQKPKPPEIGPYFFPGMLALMGAWCFYDGWLSSDPEMLEYATFNRIGSVALLTLAIVDVIRTRASEKNEKLKEEEQQSSTKNDAH